MNQVYNTLFVGKVLHHFERLSSTNAYALELTTKSKPSEGTVISTDFQEAGRGQIGRSWESAVGQNIMCSIILYPNFLLAREQFLLNQAVSLSIKATISHFGIDNVRIKWPNDIYVDDKKICGVLIQNSISGRQLAQSIIGIGINVNQKIFISDAPNPVSLAMLKDIFFSLEEVKQVLFHKIEQRYLQLKAKHFELIKTDYLSNLYRFQQMAEYEGANGDSFLAKIIGVTDIGKLQMVLKNKELKEFDFQSIRYVIQ